MKLENFFQKLGENLSYYEEEDYKNIINEASGEENFLQESIERVDYEEDLYAEYEEDYADTRSFIKMKNSYQREEQYA